MADRSAYLLQIMNQIGAPFVKAMEGKTSPAAGADASDAQDMATLLARVVEMSVGLSQYLDLGADEERADSARLALAAVCAPILANMYQSTDKIPDENDLKRIQGIIGSVLTFSDNFAPSALHISRLRSLEGDAIYADEQQNTLYIIRAMQPVFAALAEFSFGQPETVLMQDVYNRLYKDAQDLTQEIALESKEDIAKTRYIELKLLGALCEIYAQCHTSKTAALIAMQEHGAQGPDISLDDVWESYEKRKSMAFTLVSSIVPGMDQLDVSSSSGGGPAPQVQAAVEQPAPQVAPPPVPPPSSPIPETPAPAAPVEPAVQPPVSPPQTTEAPAAGAGGPMSFFKKPDQTQTTEAPASAPVSPPPAPVNPAPAQPQSPPSETPQTSAEQSSSPMSFFKKPEGSSGDGAA